MSQTSEWWRPDRHADRRPFLLARNRIAAAVRAHFTMQDFVEVDPGALVTSPGNEVHLKALATSVATPGSRTRTRYLHTSPEFACKKLLAAGENRIFTLSHVYRNGEGGPLHAPEFTMLEWYRAGATYEAIMDDCIALLRLACEATGARNVNWRDLSCDPFAAPDRLALRQAFARHYQIDLLAINRDGLANTARARGIRVADDDTWSDLFTRLLADRIEPHLGVGRPTILYEYPASEAALARRKPSDPRVAERFELYVAGVELANCFGELTDPVEQKARFTADMKLKKQIYGERYPIDKELLSALSLIPLASGAAMGFDRLVMLASGATHIDQVQWTPAG